MNPTTPIPSYLGEYATRSDDYAVQVQAVWQRHGALLRTVSDADLEALYTLIEKEKQERARLRAVAYAQRVAPFAPLLDAGRAWLQTHNALGWRSGVGTGVDLEQGVVFFYVYDTRVPERAQEQQLDKIVWHLKRTPGAQWVREPGRVVIRTLGGT